MYCFCGKRIDSTSGVTYSSATFDDKGNFIRGVCIHGYKFGKPEETQQPPQRWVLEYPMPDL